MDRPGRDERKRWGGQFKLKRKGIRILKWAKKSV
jgi:hypothetical protein